VSMTLRMRRPATSRPVLVASPGAQRSRRWVRLSVIAAGVLGSLSVAGSLAYAIYLAGVWVVAHWPQILGAFVLVALVAALVGRVLGGGSRHCPGC